jgi:hypothetical protein
MKYTVVILAALALAACKDERPRTESDSGRGYRAECIDGVEYWTRSYGNAGFMAVRVDPNTMTFVRCEVK